MAQAISRPSQGSRVRIAVTPRGFRGVRIGIWVDFSRGFTRFPCRKFHSTISPHSFHSLNFIRPYDGESGLIGRHSGYSQSFKQRDLIASNPSTLSDLGRELKNIIINKRYGHTAHTFSRLLSGILIREGCISISIRFQMTDNNTFLAVSLADLIT